jgi:tRNA threonylcarbamoyladenosine biosynthesis protein TsaB
MLILTIRTDNPEAEVGLYDGEMRLAYEKWQAHRELSITIHKKIEEILVSHSKKLSDLQGFVCFKGPGSFTGLRIGLTVANTLAYSLDAPIVGKIGKNWIPDGIKDINSGENEKIIIPEYGAEPHITVQKK